MTATLCSQLRVIARRAARPQPPDRDLAGPGREGQQSTPQELRGPAETGSTALLPADRPGPEQGILRHPYTTEDPNRSRPESATCRRVGGATSAEMCLSGERGRTLVNCNPNCNPSPSPSGSRGDWPPRSRGRHSK